MIMGSDILRFCLPIFSVLFVLTVGDRKPCGPFYLCVCKQNETFGFVEIDCTGTRVPIADVCRFTSVHSNISTLSYNSNNLSVLINEYLIGCENIQEFFLRNVSLSHVDNDTFRNMVHLSVLDLSENVLDIYSGKEVPCVYNLTSLKELRLHGNFKTENSTNISYPRLIALPGLEILYVDGLPDTTFGSNYLTLRNLFHLVLSGKNGFCNLNVLTNKTFENVRRLSKLSLSNCSITNIYAGTFEEIHNLTWLDLSMNKQLGFEALRNISYSLQFTRIDFLNLSTVHNTFGLGTMLMRRDFCYFRNTTLREVVLDSNRLELLETNLLLLAPDTLQVVHIQDNRFNFDLYLLQVACLTNLTALYTAYQRKTKSPLLYLDDPVKKVKVISQSNVDCIYDNNDYLYNRSLAIPSCSYFRSEEISETDIYSAAIPKTLKNVSYTHSNLNFRWDRFVVKPIDNSIETVDMSGNIIYSWTGPIGPFPSIKRLNLSWNYCSHVGPQAFYYLSSLEHLYVQQNFLGIPLANDVNGSVFRQLINLMVLDLSFNQIRQLPSDVFVHLRQLQLLNLSFNSLSDWSIDAQSLPNLQYIDLQSNALSGLPQSLMSHFDDFMFHEHSVFSIDMRINPLKCTCENEKVLTWMIKHQSSFVGFETYRFTDDTGQPLQPNECVIRVSNFTKTCRSFTLLIILCTVGITLFISAIITGLIYKNRWKLRYMLYMKKRRFFGYRTFPNHEPIENYKYDAFISYADENICFILDGIIPKLQREHGFELCIHQRDFVAGNAVTDNIVNAIQSSKKTVIILSRAFLKSKWCLYEFHMARMESIYSREGKSILIIIMLENMPPNDLMPLEMIEWINQKSYIEYTDDEDGDTLFWENLKLAITD